MTGTIAIGPRETALRQGHALLAREPALALEQARAMLEVDPDDPDAHRLTAKALRRLGRGEEAGAAELAAINESGRIARIRAAMEAFASGRLPDAETELRLRLDEEPEDAAALRMLADLAARSGALADAAQLLRRSLALAPGFAEARGALATVLADSQDHQGAMAELERLIAAPDGNRKHWRARFAALLSRVGRYDEALAENDAMIAEDPADAMAWMGRGHVLKTLGDSAECEASYRRAVTIDPTLGEAWWSIANLKTTRFSEADIAEMERVLAGELPERSRVNLLFALGAAREKHGDAGGSFAAYDEANRRWRAVIGYNPEWVQRRAADVRASIDAPLYTAMRGGAMAPDPIFIVGMPRAGSTLVEQILASHSAIEGTAELPYIPALALDLLRLQGQGRTIGETLASLTPGDRTELGERYLAKAAEHRRDGAPRFIDKTPNNWLFVPLILAILPRAKIIDVRRAAMACCFANFKQHFARGQAFTYDLRDLGDYYRTYCDTMAHLDAVLPGRIHRISYERLTAAPEDEIRRAVSYLGLEFEPAMMEFHRNPRAVRTASAEQVRRPISQGGNEAWRPFSPWLGPLRETLGDLAES